MAFIHTLNKSKILQNECKFVTMYTTKSYLNKHFLTEIIHMAMFIIAYKLLTMICTFRASFIMGCKSHKLICTFRAMLSWGVKVSP